jgi:hypothetical protein
MIVFWLRANGPGRDILLNIGNAIDRQASRLAKTRNNSPFATTFLRGKASRDASSVARKQHLSMLLEIILRCHPNYD